MKDDISSNGFWSPTLSFTPKYFIFLNQLSNLLLV